jgi:diguanylate cyclase (GGDEF)-like protein
MNKFISLALLFWGGLATATAATPAPLGTLREIHALTNASAHAVPVEFQATVTYFRWYEKTLFVQDGNDAIYVQAPTDIRLAPGDRILIKGTVEPSYRPFVLSSQIALLHHGAPPKPLAVNYDDLLKEEYDCKYVRLKAVVRSANLVLSSDRHSASLRLLSDGGSLEGVLDSDDEAAVQDLLDTEVSITAAVSGKFDGKMQRTGILLHIASLADIKVLKRPAVSPWSQPVTPMDEVLTGYRVFDATRRFRVRGTITLYRPGSSAVLQDGSKSIWITTSTRTPLQVGDLADATGFPDLRAGYLALTGGELRDSHIQAPVIPVTKTWKQLVTSSNIFDLVTIEGVVETAVRTASRDEYVLSSDGRLFTALYRHPAATSASLQPLPPMRQVAPGTRVRVTGVCVPENSNPFDYDRSFNLLMRSYTDISVVAPPPWLSVRNLSEIAIVFLLLAIFGGAWGWFQSRRARLQSAALAARNVEEAMLERRRSRILEDINGSRPLPEVLEEIAALVSSKLNGAPSWIDSEDGEKLGSAPLDPSAFRVGDMEIPGRSEPRQCVLHAALGLNTKPSQAEVEALSAGAGLASLAIETRRLYSDLLHRSEYDLLTNLHNRFSLDSQLEARIGGERHNASVFGLIYIDLDKFKEINDRYGHRVGDMYLCQVAERMAVQLRTVDMLARLGGDEFAALIPEVHNRADVEEIALRLERCFSEPFSVDGHSLVGTASIGVALYPEDGINRDALFNAGDAAMYTIKRTRRQKQA